ncbi:MAG: protein translocase subunit SecF [Clostridium sp.]|jgi:preprotein translocase subunit SecF|uniref:protein translocase subunit SecF n=1 Tax=Clostridium sp. TaxID=1506 RepID=UPI0025C35CCC|nr:protein translocase subunit SecF [Clostridium sp.]MCH3962890.1 protein translocase subunit SecF [Clostridium sp.]MCI1715695.1 protein translocase subunit SecF [Clostridium sp.]MCI1800100.1 protein translocase subunit SecF [Clostridium sp.]MCI1814014.1 protein translocase subunit SecF [Clostridium sp.]MCI1870912.1 protein translocase subunit SecF [Clostridium sp.]
MNNIYRIIEKRKIWFTISLIVIAIGIFTMATKGLEYGLDFKGGTVVEINLGKDFNKHDVDKIIQKYSNDFQSNKVNSKSISIKSSNLSNDDVSSIIKSIKKEYPKSTLTNQENIGASIGKEARINAIKAVIIAIAAMFIYIAIRFEFSYGMAAIIGLIHNILIMLSVYAVARVSIDSSFIAAALTVIGYSVHDTIVVFDRIRENHNYMRREDPELIADASVTQTLARSINTVVTVIITLTSVYILVPSVRNFSEPILVGIVSGCYSSICIASPCWVLIKRYMTKRKKLKTAVDKAN